MPRELEIAVVRLVSDLLRASPGQTPEWLVRPGRKEIGQRWELVQSIYLDLTGLELPEVMRPIERRTVDAVLLTHDERPRILEVDEKQHFNSYRALTLRRYGDKIPLSFDPDSWIQASERKTRLEGGGFAKPKPPLFPGEGGRHRQRAFRDALCDILPPDHGFAPTLRIADFEVASWVHTPDAPAKMESLLADRLPSR
jgi:hypothetical protein